MGFLAWLLLRILRASSSLRRYGFEELETRWREGNPVIIACWHGRSIMIPFAYTGPGVWMMNSTHRDGAIMTAALKRFGIGVTCGSSSKGGVVGLLGLFRQIKLGKDVAFVPDGPRGPAGEAKPGIAEIALRTGAPIFPLSWSASRVIRTRSWDRMMIPLPFSRVAVVAGEPVVIDSGSGDREQLQRRLEASLSRVCQQADKLVGRLPENK